MTINRNFINADSFIAALIGFYTVYFYTKYSGVGISPDSIMYVSTANNLSTHGSLITFEKTPLVLFPVFYPFFLSVIKLLTGANLITAGWVINGVLFGAVIFTSGWIMSRFITSSFIYKQLILGAIILSPALLEVYTYLWSETLFIFETLLFIIAYGFYLRKQTTTAIIVVAVLTAISCITRYAGVTLIGTGGLLLLLDKELSLKKKISHILIFVFISISLLVANLVLNRLSTGYVTGTREPSITPFVKNLYFFGTIICDWAAFGEKAYHFAALISAIIFLALAGILMWKTYSRRLNSYENIVIALALVYGLFIVTSASISRYEQISSRLVAPMFIPLLIACTSWVPDVLILFKRKSKYVLSAIVIILMLAFEYETYKTDWQRYDDEFDYGVPGYSDDDWNKSEFVAYLRQHSAIFKPGIPIYTDANEAVYLFTGMSSTLLPHRYFTADVQKFYTKGNYYLVWFNNLNNPELINLADITRTKNLVKIGGVKDDAVYYYPGK